MVDNDDKDNKISKEEETRGKDTDNVLRDQGVDEDENEESEPEDSGTAVKAVCIK